ncbi:MAG: hypothetical protein GXN92_03535 [Candidatus Micrarchaeota archaeon]|nr:hypothetical protein [Candidatus Micrarchaeota archaeon]
MALAKVRKKVEPIFNHPIPAFYLTPEKRRALSIIGVIGTGVLATYVFHQLPESLYWTVLGAYSGGMALAALVTALRKGQVWLSLGSFAFPPNIRPLEGLIAGGIAGGIKTAVVGYSEKIMASARGVVAGALSSSYFSAFSLALFGEIGIREDWRLALGVGTLTTALGGYIAAKAQQAFLTKLRRFYESLTLNERLTTAGKMIERVLEWKDPLEEKPLTYEGALKMVRELKYFWTHNPHVPPEGKEIRKKMGEELQRFFPSLVLRLYN